ncbi:MAG TPA: hypothetical protein PLL15_06140 [Syntrophales bacterium]|nr:hypothetical protein [Syntrophales bacterium]
MAKKNREAGTSMVAPHPPTTGGLKPVEELAAERGMNPAILAGLQRATGWAPGKQVRPDEFEAAARAFENRRMGGGRI